MTVVRRLARPMLAAIFIDGGLDQLRHPSSKLAKAEPLIHKLAGPLGLPDDPELLIRANGAVMVGAGAMLATGRLPRLAALVLAGTLVPTTVAGHRFWEEADPAQKRNQRTHLLKNVEPPRRHAARRRRHRRQAGHAVADPARGQGRRPHGAYGQARDQAGDQAAKAEARLAARSARKAAVDAVPFTD